MANNKAYTESLIVNSPAFQRAAQSTDELLHSDIVGESARHVQDLTETEDAISRNEIFKPFLPESNKTANPNPQTPSLQEQIVQPDHAAKSINDRDNALRAFQNIDALTGTKNNWVKPAGFNTGENDLDYDRYYNHPNFKKLGYEPFRNNELLYNANSSWYDDFVRMKSQWAGLAGEGFKSMIDQWKNPLDFSPNTQMATAFEKKMGVAMSTKDGFGAKFTNFLGNSGYTVGILTEMVAEEAVLWGATALTGGMSAAVTAPNAINAIARGMGNIYRGVKNVDKVMDSLRGTIASVRAMDSPEIARGVWNAARSAPKTVAQFLNPLRNTTEFLRTAGREAALAMEVGVGTKKITNMALIARGVGSFYKDVRMSNAAFAEARLEGGMVKNKHIKDLNAAYFNEHGKLPEGAEAEAINDSATKAGTMDALINIPMIYYTNQLVLGKAFRGWAPPALAREMAAGTKSVRFLRTVGAEGKATYTGVEGMAKFGQAAYWKQAPIIIASDMMRYTSANFAEGFQESSQDIVSVATSDYYTKIFNSPILAGHKQGYASFKKGMGAQFSEHGAETFLSGFFMGALIQGPQNLIYTHGRKLAMAAGEKIRTGTDAEGKPVYAVAKGTVEKLANERKEWINHVQKSLNDIAQNPAEYAKGIELNMVNQVHLGEAMANAVISGDRKAYLDSKQESLFQHFYTLLDAGHYENFITELQKLKGLTPEELAEAFNEKNPEGDKHNKGIHERLDSIIDHAKKIKDHYDDVNSRFVDDTNQYMVDPIKEPELFKKLKIRKVAFRDAKMFAAFGNYAFHNTLSRILSISESAVGEHKFLKDADSGSLSILFDPFRHNGQMATEITSLWQQIATLKGSTPANEAKIPALTKKVEKMVALQAAMRAFQSAHQATTAGKTITDRHIETVTNAASELRVAYNNYLEQLASEVGQPFLKENTEDSFFGLLDFIKLDSESRNMARYINHLHDPENFLKYVDAFDAEFSKQLENWYTSNKEALSKYMDREYINNFINLVFERGVFVDPNSIDDLGTGNYENIEFIRATTGGAIDKTSQEYITNIKPLVDLFSALQAQIDADAAQDAADKAELEALKAEEAAAGAPAAVVPGEPIPPGSPVISGIPVPPTGLLTDAERASILEINHIEADLKKRSDLRVKIVELEKRLARQKDLDAVFYNMTLLSTLSPTTEVNWKGRRGFISKLATENAYIFDDNSGTIYDIVPDSELGWDAPLVYYGVTVAHDPSILDVMKVGEKNGRMTITINDQTFINKFSNPLYAITYNAQGEVESVRLDVPRTEGIAQWKGARIFTENAEEIAYLITLYSLNQLNHENIRVRKATAQKLTTAASRDDVERKTSPVNARDKQEGEKIEAELKELLGQIKTVKNTITETLEQPTYDTSMEKYKSILRSALAAKRVATFLKHWKILKASKLLNAADVVKLEKAYKKFTTKPLAKAIPLPKTPKPAKAPDLFTGVPETPVEPVVEPVADLAAEPIVEPAKKPTKGLKPTPRPEGEEVLGPEDEGYEPLSTSKPLTGVVPIEEPPVTEGPVVPVTEYGDPTNIQETEVKTEITDSKEIIAIREKYIHKIVKLEHGEWGLADLIARSWKTQGEAQVEILMGRLDTELRSLEGLPEVAEAPVAEEAKSAALIPPAITDTSLRLQQLTERIEEVGSEAYWAEQSGDPETIASTKQELTELWNEYNVLKGKKEKTPTTPSKSGIELIDSINNATSIKEVLDIRREFASLPDPEKWNIYKKINGTELTKLFDSKITALAKSVTFATTVPTDYLIMADITRFPTKVALVTSKSGDIIRVQPIRADGTPDVIRVISISEENFKKEVENVYSEQLDPKTIEPVVDKTTEKLSDDSIKENTTSSADEKKKAIAKGKTTPLAKLKENLKKPRC